MRTLNRLSTKLYTKICKYNNRFLIILYFILRGILQLLSNTFKNEGGNFMLNFIDTLPTDKQIAGVHCIPINEQGMIMLAWDKDEQLITTIGGRVENSETLEEALVREVMEEVGITLMEEKIPFASWYWPSTDTYTVWYLSKVKTLGKYDFQNEKTGYLISNFLTFELLITQLENEYAPRLQILQLAKKKAVDMQWITR